jgi:hypothetical protein
MGSKYEGYCRLCGKLRKLSFEHIPPKSAFNNHPRILQTLHDHLDGRSHSKYRRGLGKYSLCEDCNNHTGGWYGEAFVNWTKQGFEWFDKVKGEKMINLPYYIKPVNVLKQVLVMALAMSSEGTISFQKELRRYLLSPTNRYMPSDYRVFTYFNMEGQLRFASEVAILDVTGKGSDLIQAEVALPPFGYCVTRPDVAQKSLAETKGLYEITWFSGYYYNEWVNVHLRIPTRETHFPSPLDYRNKWGMEES